MRRKFPSKPAALAVSAALSLGGVAQASVFQARDLPSGYRLAAADKPAEGDKAREARCGADCEKNLKGMSAAAAKAACDKAHKEGKCGTAKERKEGKCGGKDKESSEGNCGGISS